MGFSFKHQLGLVCVVLLLPALCNCKEYFTQSRASYYGSPDGYGHPNEACGFGEYGRTVNDGKVTDVSARLWKNGGGCGACYQVRCKIPQLCSYNGAFVVTTGYGEGDRTDFIMSPRGFSELGRNKNASDELFKYGVVDVEYKRVPCTFKGNDNIMFKINEHSQNPGYFAIVVLYVGGTNDITTVEMWQIDHNQWEPLRRSYGAVFDYANPPRGAIPLRFKLGSSRPKLCSLITIPGNWKAGATYTAKIRPCYY
ncbi:RlpA-like protein, double-psi beta-barrel domain [Sesbania bispinosa]|nr:RlpA-like protein, double-psi beta-barrel domain [Sesbania bispinosa]